MNISIGNGAMGELGSGSEIVSCVNFGQLLTNRTRKTVDLWILDIEGSEMPVVRNFRWQDFDIRYFMIEDYWIPSRVVNSIMSLNSYRMELQLGLDTIFSKKDHSIWNVRNLLDGWNGAYKFHTRKNYQGGCSDDLVAEGNTLIKLSF